MTPARFSTYATVAVIVCGALALAARGTEARGSVEGAPMPSIYEASPDYSLSANGKSVDDIMSQINPKPEVKPATKSEKKAARVHACCRA